MRTPKADYFIGNSGNQQKTTEFRQDEQDVQDWKSETSAPGEPEYLSCKSCHPVECISGSAVGARRRNTGPRLSPAAEREDCLWRRNNRATCRHEHIAAAEDSRAPLRKFHISTENSVPFPLFSTRKRLKLRALQLFPFFLPYPSPHENTES